MQRILVIDDDPLDISLLKCSIFYQGFAVEMSQCGAEGLAITCERRTR